MHISEKQALVPVRPIRPSLTKRASGLFPIVVIVLSVFITLPFSCAVGGEESLFSVKSYEFCRDVVNNVPLRPYENPAQFRKEEALWIWLEIAVNPNGYRFLKSLRKFPVYVTWGKDGWLIGKAVDVGITPEQWDANEQGIRWKSKNSRDATFTWRTNAVRKTIVSAEYYVSVLDANRKPVTTLEDTAVSFRPKIQVIYGEK